MKIPQKGKTKAIKVIGKMTRNQEKENTNFLKLSYEGSNDSSIKRLFKVYKTEKERKPFCTTCVLSKPPRTTPLGQKMTTRRQLKMKTVADLGNIKSASQMSQ
jgi:hypothetical protein